MTTDETERPDEQEQEREPMEEGGAEPGAPSSGGQLDQSEADYDPGEDPDTDPPASAEQP